MMARPLSMYSYSEDNDQQYARKDDKDKQQVQEKSSPETKRAEPPEVISAKSIMRRTNSNLSKKGSDKSSQPKAAQLYSRAASETNLQKKANPPPFNVANNNVMASVKKQLHNTVVAFGRTTRVKDAEMTKSTSRPCTSRPSSSNALRECSILNKLEKLQQQVDAQNSLIEEMKKEKSTNDEKVMNLTRFITDISNRVLSLESNNQHPCRYMEPNQRNTNSRELHAPRPTNSKNKQPPILQQSSDNDIIVEDNEIDELKSLMERNFLQRKHKENERPRNAAGSELVSPCMPSTRPTNNKKVHQQQPQPLHPSSDPDVIVEENEIDELKSLMERKLIQNPSMLHEVRRLLTSCERADPPRRALQQQQQQHLRNVVQSPQVYYGNRRQAPADHLPPHSAKYTQISTVEYLLPPRQRQHRIRTTEPQRMHRNSRFDDERFFDEDVDY